MDEVRNSGFAKRAAAIYALIYEAEAWDRAHPRDKIDLSRMSKGLLAGEFDSVLRKTVHDEKIGFNEKVGALWNARGLKMLLMP